MKRPSEFLGAAKYLCTGFRFNVLLFCFFTVALLLFLSLSSQLSDKRDREMLPYRVQKSVSMQGRWKYYDVIALNTITFDGPGHTVTPFLPVFLFFGSSSINTSSFRKRKKKRRGIGWPIGRPQRGNSVFYGSDCDCLRNHESQATGFKVIPHKFIASTIIRAAGPWTDTSEKKNALARCFFSTHHGDLITTIVSHNTNSKSFQPLSFLEYSHTSTRNKWYLGGTVPLSHIHIIFTVYIVYKPPREWVQWL